MENAISMFKNFIDLHYKQIDIYEKYLIAAIVRESKITCHNVTACKVYKHKINENLRAGKKPITYLLHYNCPKCRKELESRNYKQATCVLMSLTGYVIVKCPHCSKKSVLKVG